MRTSTKCVAVGLGTLALSLGGTGLSSAGLDSGTPNCQSFFNSTLSTPNGVDGVLITLDVAHINANIDKGDGPNGGRCIEMADVAIVKGGGTIIHTIKIPWRYKTGKNGKQRLMKLSTGGVKSLQYNFYFNSNARAETSNTRAGSVSISPTSLGFGLEQGATYELLNGKRQGKLANLSRASKADSCTVAPDKQNEEWFVYCRIDLPYDATTYRWPDKRTDGGLQSISLWSRMIVKYGGSSFATSGEASTTHRACKRLAVDEGLRCSQS